MNKRIRFHLDENVTPAIAIGLRLLLDCVVMGLMSLQQLRLD